MKTAAEREIAQAESSFEKYMNEEVTDTQQFGHPVAFARKKLYTRVLDFLEKGALFGLYLAGYRAGRWFENTHPDAAPRVVNTSLEMRKLIEKSGAVYSAGMLVFNERALERYSTSLIQSAAGRYVKLDLGPLDDSELSVEALVNERMMAFCEQAMVGELPNNLNYDEEKRETVAKHLWTMDQKRVHQGAILGKWEDVGKQYKEALFARAAAYLAFFHAMELMVKPYDPPVKPTYADAGSICTE